jgi:hypothetical protein
VQGVNGQFFLWCEQYVSVEPSAIRRRMGSLVRLCCITAGLGGIFYLLVRRVGLAPHDVLLVFTVGAYATVERWRGHGTTGTEQVLLGEEAAAADGVRVRWQDFVCEHHQLLGCIVRGRKHNRRGRSERILSLAVSTLALLYWKAIFRPPPVRMQSLQGLRASLWTLLVSKAVQQLMKLGIRFAAGRTAAWQASASWLDALQLQWQIAQYWTIGFMMLCVMLALLEGRTWPSLLVSWLVNMSFALTFFDLAFTYVRFKIVGCYLEKRRLARRRGV